VTKFRPCIDLHGGVVKQIVGGTLKDGAAEELKENFVSEKAPSWYAGKFCEAGLTGGHVIKLGAGNEVAAREALAAWPEGMQIGGGINAENAAEWLEAGASHVIVTSWLFDEEGRFLEDRLGAIAHEGSWRVAMNRWQTLTDLELDLEVMMDLSVYCDEFLIHAADVEGLCQGVDEDLVTLFKDWKGCPVTYAGGVRNLADAQKVNELSGGQVDLTVGSALDIFGGEGMSFEEMVSWNSD